MKKIILFLTFFFCLQPAYAALYARDLDGDFSNGHEGIYDDILDVTWMADANKPNQDSFGTPYPLTMFWSSLTGHFHLRQFIIDWRHAAIGAV